jgi:hypothetical protein
MLHVMRQPEDQNSPYGRVVGLLEQHGRMQRLARGYLACCPAHADGTPSLKVDQGDDGRVLLHCKAGCSTGDIAAALGIEQRELFADSQTHTREAAPRQGPPATLAELARMRHLPEAFLASLGWRDSARGIEIPYRTRGGALHVTRLRRGLTIKDGVWWSPSKVPLAAYEPDQGALAREERYLIVCEGETDTATLLYAGFPALGVPGADAAGKVLDGHHLAGIERVYFVREPDRGGDQFAKLVPERLAELGFTGGVHQLKMPGSAKDPSALWVRDTGAFPKLLTQALTEAARGPMSALDELWRPIGTWITEQPSPRRWLLTRPDDETNGATSRGVLPVGKAGMLFAEGGTGKTFALIQLAVSIVTGRRWLDYFDVPHTGPVLLALGEEDKEEIHRRLFAVARAMRLTEEQERLAGEQIIALPLAGKMVSIVGGDGTSDSEFMRWLRARLKGQEFRLVVLDPLSRYAGGDTEKDNASATRFVQQVESLVTPDCTVLVSHHSRKPSNSDPAGASAHNARGVTALGAGFRWTAELQQIGTGARFAVTKSNYAPRGRPLDLQRDDDTGYLTYSSAPIVPSRVEENESRYARDLDALVDIVRRHPGKSRAALIAMSGISDRKGTAMFDELEQRGLLSHAEGPRGAKQMHLAGSQGGPSG